MMVSSCLCRAGSSMRRSVSIALRIDDSGFLISCATSAANVSIASIRAHSACAESDSAAPARRPRRAARSSGAGTLPARPWPSRISAAAPARRRIGRAMVSDRYQDSSTVSASARPNSARIDMRTTNRLVVHLARLARQQDDADGVVVALHRLGDGHQQPVVLGAADIGRHLAALAGAVEPQLLLHVRLPVEAAPRSGVMSTTSGVGVSCGSSASTWS